MISREEALELTQANFPNGPEALAQHLSVPFFSSPIQGFDGWCAHATNTVIVVNSNLSKSRQRFTLGHELAHLILGTESDVYCQPFCSDKAEEKAADSLAAEFLIPWEKLTAMGGNEVPVVSNTVSYIANAAKVSPLVAASRIVSSCDRLGLMNAAMVFIQSGKEVWRYSNGLKFTSEYALELAIEIASSSSNIVRKTNHDDGNLIVGSLIDCWEYQLLLVQLLPPDLAKNEAKAEKVERIRKEIFEGDRSFEGKVAAALGTIKSKVEITTLEQAVAMYYSGYLQRLSVEQQTKLNSADGRFFVRTRLSKWLN